MKNESSTEGLSYDSSKRKEEKSSLRYPPVRGVITVVCCLLLNLTLGVSYSSGNLSPYLTSYLRNSTGDTSINYSKTLWVDMSGFLCGSMSLLFLGKVEQRIPTRLYLTIGWILFTASFVGNYWAVQLSFVATVCIYGIPQGFARFIIMPCACKLGIQWFPERKGLVNGIVMGGYGGGALFWNQMITAWINPHNLQPDQNIDESLYFTQPEVLNRVPSCYLLLGGVLGGIQLLCLFLISFPPSISSANVVASETDVTSTNEIDATAVNETDVTSRHCQRMNDSPTNAKRDITTATCTLTDVTHVTVEANNVTSTSVEDSDAASTTIGASDAIAIDLDVTDVTSSIVEAGGVTSTTVEGSGITSATAATVGADVSTSSGARRGANPVDAVNGKQMFSVASHKPVAMRDGAPASRGMEMAHISMGVDNLAFVDHHEQSRRSAFAIQENSDGTESANKMTVLEILRSRALITLFVHNLTLDLGFLLIKFFHKAYAQTFIPDDRVLSLAASVAPVFNAMGRPLWGVLADRFGLVPMYVIAMTILSCMTSTFLLCEWGGTVMFFTWLCAIYFSISGPYCLLNPIIYDLFGSKNFISALGIMLSDGVILSPTLVYVSSALQHAFGWHGLFLFAAALIFLSLSILSSFVLDCGRPLSPRMQRALFSRRRSPQGPARAASSDMEKNEKQ